MKPFLEVITEQSPNDKLDKLTHNIPLSTKRLKQLNNFSDLALMFDFEGWQNYPPPSNSSKIVFDEIQYLIGLQEFRDQWETDMRMHDTKVMKAFGKYVDKHNLEVDLDEIKRISDQADSIILSLKRFYNRPRPKVLANKLGLGFSFFPLKTAETPSYPSGHATHGRLVAKLVADEVPFEHRRNIIRLGEDIGEGRMVAGAHYPSDTNFGHLLGDELYRLAKSSSSELKLESLLTEIEFSNKAAMQAYNAKHKMRPTTKVKISGKETTAKDADPDAFKDDEKDKEEPKKKKKTTEIPKNFKKLFGDKPPASARDAQLYMSDKDKALVKAFEKEFEDLHSDPTPEKAEALIKKYGLEASTGAKPKVYMRNISFESRKFLGQNKMTEFIKDTIEDASGKSLKNMDSTKSPKQEVTTTSKPDLKTKRSAKDDKNVQELFSKSPYNRLGDEFHQVFGPTGKDGNILTPSHKHSKDYLKQSIDENNSIRNTITKLKDLEKSSNVSPKIRGALEDHQKEMDRILKDVKVPSKEAEQAVGNSYAKMAETMHQESPDMAKAMMKNMAEMALYDTEIAGGQEAYLPSAGSFPSGDKIRVDRDGKGKVEKVASVSVKYGRTKKDGAWGFPGESGQYQKYHPDPEYRDRLHSRPGDDGYEIGVKDEIVQSDEKMGKIAEESGIGSAIKDEKKFFKSIRDNANAIKKLKEEIDYEQKPKRGTKPAAWRQLNAKKKELLALEKEHAAEMAKHVDKKELENLIGKDNTRLAMKSPATMMSVLTFASTLKTSNGLDTIEHNHQEIKEGKYESHTDTAADGTPNIKNWKLGWRAYDQRAGGLISSFNSERKDIPHTDPEELEEKLYRFNEWNF